MSEPVLRNMIKSGRLPGAFIFEGPPELTGALADSLACAVVCPDAKPRGEACGACRACFKSRRNAHPDIISAGPEGAGARSFHIDKVRDIIDGLYLAPNESGRKVYIMREMQNMTEQGQNALLKSLEEPPAFAMFIMTASSLDLVLETVRSRAVKFSVHGRDAAPRPQDEYGGLIRDILDRNADKLAAYRDTLKKLDKSGKPGALSFYGGLENAARDVLVTKIFGDGAPLLYFNECPERFARDYSVRRIMDLCRKISDFKSELEYNANTRLNVSSFFGAVT